MGLVVGIENRIEAERERECERGRRESVAGALGAGVWGEHLRALGSARPPVLPS